MPEIDDAIYVQRYDDEYFKCQRIRNDELVMAGILTLEQLATKYPTLEPIHAEPPVKIG